jgi:hypothetical protein
MNDDQAQLLRSRLAQWDRAQSTLEATRIMRLREATEMERMAERLLLFADVDPMASWISRRAHSGLVEQQLLLRQMSAK